MTQEQAMDYLRTKTDALQAMDPKKFGNEQRRLSWTKSRSSRA
jgi:hypothetical protein